MRTLSGMRYRDRYEAGRALGERLAALTAHPDLLVLGLPRGGVPVAWEVARRLGAPLDVFVVRKLGFPGHEELARGAIAREASGSSIRKWSGMAWIGRRSSA